MPFAYRGSLVGNKRLFPIGEIQYYLSLWMGSVQGYYVEGLRSGFRRTVHRQGSVVLVTVIDWLLKTPRKWLVAKVWFGATDFWSSRFECGTISRGKGYRFH